MGSKSKGTARAAKVTRLMVIGGRRMGGPFRLCGLSDKVLPNPNGEAVFELSEDKEGAFRRAKIEGDVVAGEGGTRLLTLSCVKDATMLTMDGKRIKVSYDGSHISYA